MAGQKSFGSARAYHNGISYPLSDAVEITHGDDIDEYGNYFLTEKQQHHSPSSAPVRTYFTPEITFPLQLIEGLDINEIIGSADSYFTVTFGGSTYSIVGGFRVSQGVKVSSGDGKANGITITGGKFYKQTS